MSIVKVIELIAESESSWEDATKNALNEAKKTVQNIQSIYVKDMKAIVGNNEIKKYRLNAKISFTINE